MLKRTLYAILLIFIFILGTSSILFNASAPPTGYTGQTSGTTCGDGGCHTSHANNSGGGNIATSLPSTYTPGATINFSTIITHAAPAASRWGFSIKAVDGGGNAIGTFSTTNAAVAVNSDELSHINAPAGPASASKTYNNLSWTAPALNSGSITFYFASVTGPNNGDDYVYTGAVTLNPVISPIESELVGIGTNTPFHKLHVNGNIWMGVQQTGTGFTAIQDAIYLGSPRKYLSNTLGTSVDGSVDWINLMAHPSSKGIMFGTSGPSDIDPHTSPLALMVIRPDGNVGIGTPAPVSKLNIIGSPQNPSIPGIASTAILRVGTSLNEGIDIGKMAIGPYSGWLQSGYNTNTTDPLSLNPIGGFVGIGTLEPTATLSVNGTANNSTGSWGVFSDARVKTIKSEFTDGLNVLKQIKPVWFMYNETAPYKAAGEQIGIIAQDLEKAAPYMVSKIHSGKYTDLREVNNQAYTYLLINAVKEQQQQLEQLRSDFEKLKQENGNLKSEIDQIKIHLGIGSKTQK